MCQYLNNALDPGWTLDAGPEPPGPELGAGVGHPAQWPVQQSRSIGQTCP